MRASLRLREILATHMELAWKLSEFEARRGKHDRQIVALIEAVCRLSAPSPTRRQKPIGFPPGAGGQGEEEADAVKPRCATGSWQGVGVAGSWGQPLDYASSEKLVGGFWPRIRASICFSCTYANGTSSRIWARVPRAGCAAARPLRTRGFRPSPSVKGEVCRGAFSNRPRRRRGLTLEGTLRRGQVRFGRRCGRDVPPIRPESTHKNHRRA